MELTIEEINTMINALDVWQKESMSDALTSAMLGMAFIQDKEKAEAYVDEKQAEAKRKMQDREETVILLKSKLVYTRRQIEKTQFISEAREVIA